MNADVWGIGDRQRRRIADFPPDVLALVEHRQGGRFCVLCREQGLVTPEHVPLVLDHLRPVSQGGDNHHLNLRWLCESHNAGRRDRPLWAGRPAWERQAARPTPTGDDHERV